MRIIISTLTFDPFGWVVIDAIADSKARDIGRRVNRVATLDGGAAFNDFGMTDADRVIEVVWRKYGIEDAVIRMVRTYSFIRVSTNEGVFVAAIESYSESDSEKVALRLLVKHRVAP